MIKRLVEHVCGFLRNFIDILCYCSIKSLIIYELINLIVVVLCSNRYYVTTPTEKRANT